MTPAEVEQAIRDYIANVEHLSLGTAVNDRPWVSEVHFVYDKDLNIYFRSKDSRRHSQEIAANPNVAGDIVEDHESGQKPRAVYFEGQASIVEGVDQHHPVFKLFMKRFDFKPQILKEPDPEDSHRFFKITASDYYLFDSRQSVPSQKYHLPWPTTRK